MKRSRFYDAPPSPEKKAARIKIYANIDGADGVNAAKACGADGIGLLRSEFLYLENTALPCEEAQLSAYKSVLLAMRGKPVTVRTADLGADKIADYLMPDYEENPALGLRGIRFCLARPEIFRTQLRALYRASVYGKLRIMYPMITDISELFRINSITQSVKEELEKSGIPYSDGIKTGIMIETPAAAILSDELAPMADFFSIGTNDLSQFTYACDRQNGKLAPFYGKNHRALFRLIETTVKNAHNAGIPAGICGELAADPAYAVVFMDMGADFLSVSPRSIGKLCLFRQKNGSF